MYSSKIGRNEEVKITFSVPNTSITSEWVANITYTGQSMGKCLHRQALISLQRATGNIDDKGNVVVIPMSAGWEAHRHRVIENL